MKGYRWLTVCFLSLITVFVITAAGKQELIEQGNTAYAAGNYKEALEFYSEYESTEPESPEAAFNKGVVSFRLEEYEQARENFREAALRSDDLGLEAKANFNLGNTAFMQAGRMAQSDLEKAIETYYESITFYQRAMELDPELTQAAHNIETVRLILKDMLDKQKEQARQQQEQQEKLKEILEKIMALIQEEQEIIELSGNLQAERANGATDGSLRGRTDGVRLRQQTNREGTREVAEQLGELMQEDPASQATPPVPSDNPLSRARIHVERAANFQELAEKKLEAMNWREAIPAQEDARDELVQAVEALSDPQNQQGEDGNRQEQQAEQGEQQEDEGQQQKNVQQQAAEDILDEEQENREERDRQQSRYYAPAKDY